MVSIVFLCEQLGFAKKNYTDHVPTPDEEVDGLDFGSGHLAYQQRVGNALPAYIL